MELSQTYPKTLYTIAHTECSTGWGGQEIRIFTEMEAMQKRGHRLLLVSPSHTTLYKKSKEAGFPVFDFNDKALSYLVSISRLARFFKREKVQVVNTHSSRDGWIAGLAARLARVPLLIRSRHIDVEYKKRFSSRIAFGWLPHHILTTSNRITTNLAQSLHLDPSRVETLPTGIDLNHFGPLPYGKLHQKLGLTPDTRLVGIVAVLRSWKGHIHFLGAAKKILQIDSNIHFILAGEGPYRGKIEEAVGKLDLKPYVHFLGHCENVNEILAGLDVVVLASTAHEGVPQVLLQAMAMKRPIVGTQVGGIPEVVQDGVTGLLVPPADPEALAQVILRLLNNSTLSRQIAKNGREYVATRYSIEQMCQQLEKIYTRYLQPSI